MAMIACLHCTAMMKSGGKCGGCGFDDTPYEIAVEALRKSEDKLRESYYEGISEADAKGVCRGCGRPLNDVERRMGSHFSCDCGEVYD